MASFIGGIVSIDNKSLQKNQSFILGKNSRSSNDRFGFYRNNKSTKHYRLDCLRSHIFSLNRTEKTRMWGMLTIVGIIGLESSIVGDNLSMVSSTSSVWLSEDTCVWSCIGESLC